jgi:hypothetical protein
MIRRGSAERDISRSNRRKEMNEEWKRRDVQAKALFNDENIHKKSISVLVFRERLNLVHSVDELRYVINQARVELSATELSPRGSIDSIDVLKNILALDRPFKIIFQLDSIDDIEGLINLSVYAFAATRQADATTAARLAEVNMEIWTKIVTLAADKLGESNKRIKGILYNKNSDGVKDHTKNKRKEFKTEILGNIMLAEKIMAAVEEKRIIGETINKKLLLLKDELNNCLELYGPDSIQSIKTKAERILVGKLGLRPRTTLIVGLIILTLLLIFNYLPSLMSIVGNKAPVASSRYSYTHIPNSVLVRIINKSDKAALIDSCRYVLYLPDDNGNYSSGSYFGLRGNFGFMPILTEQPFDPGGYPILLGGHGDLILEASLNEGDSTKLDKDKETILQRDALFLFILCLNKDEEYIKRGFSFKEYFIEKKMIVFEIEPK